MAARLDVQTRVRVVLLSIDQSEQRNALISDISRGASAALRRAATDHAVRAVKFWK